MLDQILASTRPSQSYHHAMFDSSMPDSFDSVDVAFSHLPRSSSFVSIITSSTSSFRSSLFRLNHPSFTLSLPFQLPSTPSSLLPLVASISPSSTQEARLPPPLLSLLRSSFFVSLGNAFSSLVRTFTSFLLSYLFHHSIPASEVPT